MEYGDDGTHLVEILDDWIPYAARSAISDELATLGERGFPLAPIHTHSEQANFTVAGLAYPGSVGDANNEEDGGCPVGSAKVGKECLLRPRADVERNYVARGGENKQAETVPRLLARLQSVTSNACAVCVSILYSPQFALVLWSGDFGSTFRYKN